jgi:hypothetical protein
MKVRRFAKNARQCKNPGVHHTAGQSRDREGALADYEAGMRSLTVAALSGVSRPSKDLRRVDQVLRLIVRTT